MVDHLDVDSLNALFWDACSLQLSPPIDACKAWILRRWQHANDALIQVYQGTRLCDAQMSISNPTNQVL